MYLFVKMYHIYLLFEKGQNDIHISHILAVFDDQSLTSHILWVFNSSKIIIITFILRLQYKRNISHLICQIYIYIYYRGKNINTCGGLIFRQQTYCLKFPN